MNAQRPHIILKDKTDLAHMRAAGKLVAECFAALEANIRPGVTLRELDRLAEALIEKRGATGLYKGYVGPNADHPPFPGVICASVNHEVCHGLPNNRALKEGDIVGIDLGLKYRGWCGDACVTFPVGRISPEAQRLLEVARETLYAGIRASVPGGYLNDVGFVIERHARRQRMTVVKEWGGHGIGRDLHEDPSVPHTRERGRGPRLRPGMTYTIEPMVNIGRREWLLQDDGWTVVTKDGSLSAQFEHTIAITENGPEILTLP